jgi:hypothetical protein
MLEPEIEYFIDQAQEYCSFVETANDFELAAQLSIFSVRLSALYAAGLRLPDDLEGTAGDPPAAPDPLAHWSGLGDFTLYWQVPDPFDWGAPEVGSLSDDLLGIYRDIKAGFLLLDDSEESLDRALFHWQATFVSHWAQSAVDALRILHHAQKHIANGD